MPSILRLAAEWGVEPSAEPFTTASSRLLAGLRGGEPVMLKLALIAEERRGNAVLEAWAGRGAARVLERRGAAVLMERATGPFSVTAVGSPAEDEAATQLLCDALAVVHAVPDPGVPAVDVGGRLRALLREPPPGHPAAALHRRAAGVAHELLADSTERILLHGDAHHGNLLDFGDERTPRLLLIDPKGVRGPRAFDHLPLFLNPDPASALRYLDARIAVVAERTGTDRRAIAAWAFTYAALSAAWSIEDRTDASAALAVAAALQSRVAGAT